MPLRQFGQREQRQRIAYDGAAAVTDNRCRVIAEGSRRDRRKPDGGKGGIGLAICRIAPPAHDRRDQEQSRAAKHRRAGRSVNVEGCIEDLVDIGGCRQRIGAYQGGGKADRAQAESRDSVPVGAHERKDGQARRHHSRHGAVRLKGHRSGCSNDARRRQRVPGPRERDEHHGQQDQAGLDGQAAEVHPSRRAIDLLAEQSGCEQYARHRRHRSTGPLLPRLHGAVEQSQHDQTDDQCGDVAAQIARGRAGDRHRGDAQRNRSDSARHPDCAGAARRGVVDVHGDRPSGKKTCVAELRGERMKQM